MTSHLFQPLTLGPFELTNRIAVSPMCQYSADDGSATDWHLQHLMQLAISGAGLVMVEATAVERSGRITHGCLGLYSDSNERHLARVMSAARAVAPPGARFGLQLAHAGRKASVRLPWQGGKPLAPGEALSGALSDDPWPTVAPSALPFAEGWHTPTALTEAGLGRIVAAFVQAAERAVRIGFDVLELHFAHGYLGHQFFSPLANQRDDDYGGSLANRMRMPFRLADAVHAAVSKASAAVAIGARITATDWVDGGVTLDETIALARGLRERGVSYVCVSSGGVAPAQVPTTPAFLAPYAERVRHEAAITTRFSGLIADALRAEAIIAAGQADQVALGRAFLDDPRWVWQAADRLGATVSVPPQYQRSRPAVWAGAGLARPKDG